MRLRSPRLAKTMPTKILAALDAQTVVVPGTTAFGRVIAGVAAQLRDVRTERDTLAAELEDRLGMFTIFQFADDIDRDVVSIETHSGDRYLEEQSSVLESLRMFDAVTHKSLDDVDARDLLTKLMSNLSPPKDKR